MASGGLARGPSSKRGRGGCTSGHDREASRGSAVTNRSSTCAARGEEMMNLPYEARRAASRKSNWGPHGWFPGVPARPATAARRREQARGRVAKRWTRRTAGVAVAGLIKVKFDGPATYVIGGLRRGPGSADVSAYPAGRSLQFRGGGRRRHHGAIEGSCCRCWNRSPPRASVRGRRGPREDARGATGARSVVDVRYGNRPRTRLRFRGSCGSGRTKRPRRCQEGREVADPRWKTDVKTGEERSL